MIMKDRRPIPAAVRRKKEDIKRLGLRLQQPGAASVAFTTPASNSKRQQSICCYTVRAVPIIHQEEDRK